jgi:hypothetical protein
MASNGKPQFLEHVFSEQSNGAVTETLDASVGKIKPRSRAVAQPLASLNRSTKPRNRAE